MLYQLSYHRVRRRFTTDEPHHVNIDVRAPRPLLPAPRR
jgi:hypothetical protein